jgi:TonB family protein
MERPSHIMFDTSTHNVSRRLPLLSLALCFQAAVFWLFTHGLMGHLIPVVHGPIDLVPVHHTDDLPQVPPPKPHIPKTVDGPHVSPPIFDVGPDQTRNSITTTPFETTKPKPVAVPDRAPISNVSTHTVPPYPPIARRIGAEGKVTFRLTVTAEGRVGQADVVTSSGRDDLDQTAQQWILAHWAYKPALKDGVPAVSHTLASVTFSLVNER